MAECEWGVTESPAPSDRVRPGAKSEAHVVLRVGMYGTGARRVV